MHIHSRPGHRSWQKTAIITATTVLTAGLLAACSAPGSSAPQSASSPASTDLGSTKITLRMEVGSTAVAAYRQLGADFTKQHPNVTVDVIGDTSSDLVANAPRIIAGSNPPDLVNLDTYGNLVKDHLIVNLDAYAKAYGWDSWPQSQFASLRENAAGTERGTGSIYGASAGYGLTGVYYNKKILAKLGASVPTTLAQFEALLKAAKAAGYTGLESDGEDGGLVYPLENLAIDYGGAASVQAWNYDQPHADIDTAATVNAAKTLQSWARSGYLNSDVNSISLTTAPAEFEQGKTLFWASGNWEAPGLDQAMPNETGFFLFPAEKAGETRYAMTAPELLVVPQSSTHHDAAAAFLNFIQTNAAAREVSATQLGLVPAGPANASTPKVSGSSETDTVAQFAQASKTNGLVDFLNNATASISTNTLTPQTQLLVSGKTTPAAFASKVQADYVADLNAN